MNYNYNRNNEGGKAELLIAWIAFDFQWLSLIADDWQSSAIIDNQQQSMAFQTIKNQAYPRLWDKHFYGWTVKRPKIRLFINDNYNSEENFYVWNTGVHRGWESPAGAPRPKRKKAAATRRTVKKATAPCYRKNMPPPRRCHNGIQKNVSIFKAVTGLN